MKKIRIKFKQLLILIILALGYVCNSMAQGNPGLAGDFGRFANSPRQLGMGRCFGILSGADSNYGTPSGLSGISLMQVSGFVTVLPFSNKYGSISFASPINKEKNILRDIYLGLSVTHFTVNDLVERDEIGLEKLRSFSYGQTIYSIGACYDLRKNCGIYSFGLRFDSYIQNFEGGNSQNSFWRDNQVLANFGLNVLPLKMFGIPAKKVIRFRFSGGIFNIPLIANNQDNDTYIPDFMYAIGYFIVHNEKFKWYLEGDVIKSVCAGGISGFSIGNELKIEFSDQALICRLGYNNFINELTWGFSLCTTIIPTLPIEISIAQGLLFGNGLMDMNPCFSIKINEESIVNKRKRNEYIKARNDFTQLQKIVNNYYPDESAKDAASILYEETNDGYFTYFTKETIDHAIYLNQIAEENIGKKTYKKNALRAMKIFIEQFNKDCELFDVEDINQFMKCLSILNENTLRNKLILGID